MKEEIKTYLILGLGVILIVLFLLKGCTNPFPNLNVNPKKQTILIKEHDDTIWTHDTLVSFKSIIRPKWDTIYKFNDTIKADIDKLDYIREYNDTLVDSQQTIYSKANITGLLNKLDISYKLKRKPELITNTDSIFITKIQPDKMVSLYSGLRLSGNNTSLDLSPYIELNKDKLSISASYGLINKVIGIGVGIRIFKK